MWAWASETDWVAIACHMRVVSLDPKPNTDDLKFVLESKAWVEGLNVVQLAFWDMFRLGLVLVDCRRPVLEGDLVGGSRVCSDDPRPAV